MADLATIEKQTQEFAEKRKCLETRVQRLKDEIEAVKRRHLPAVKIAAEDVAACQAALHETIKDSPDKFRKPKSLVIGGVRVGFKKEKGKILFEDEETVIRLIRKHLSAQEEQLIKTTEKVLKGGLAHLSGAELKKIGVEVKADSDQVLIKPIGDDIDKFVSALLEEGEKILREVA